MSLNERGKILVVHDSWMALENVRASLNSAGYDVRVAADALVAAKFAPWADLAIVDFHMPALDGSALVATLRDEVKAPDLPLFYLQTTDPEIARKCESHGFDGAFLKKPDASALVPQVDAVFRSIKLRKVKDTLRLKRSDPDAS
jgi:CheY-like chemotaxis protein